MGIATVTAARILAGQQRGATGEENLLSFEELPYTAFSKTYTVGFPGRRVGGDDHGAHDRREDALGGARRRRERGARRLRGGEGGVGADLARARRGRGQVDRRRDDHHDHARDARAAATRTRPERNWESDAKLSPEARAAGFPDIARQLVEFSHGDGLEVAFGGGRAFFLPSAAGGERLDGRDLTAEWQKRFAGAPYVATREALLALDPTKSRHALGLFAPSHLEFESMRAEKAPTQPSLAEMTAAALDILAEEPEGLRADGRGRAHRPRPPRGQRLPRAHRDDRVRRRREGGAREDQPEGHA